MAEHIKRDLVSCSVSYDIDYESFNIPNGETIDPPPLSHYDGNHYKIPKVKMIWIQITDSFGSVIGYDQVPDLSSIPKKIEKKNKALPIVKPKIEPIIEMKIDQIDQGSRSKSKKKKNKNSGENKDDNLLNLAIASCQKFDKIVERAHQMTIMIRIDVTVPKNQIEKYNFLLDGKINPFKINETNSLIRQKMIRDSVDSLIDIVTIKNNAISLIDNCLVDENGNKITSLVGDVSDDRIGVTGPMLLVEKGILFNLAFHNEIPIIATSCSINPFEMTVVIETFVDERRVVLRTTFDRLLVIALLSSGLIDEEEVCKFYEGEDISILTEDLPETDYSWSVDRHSSQFNRWTSLLKEFCDAVEDQEFSYVFSIIPLLCCGKIGKKIEYRIGAKLVLLWQCDKGDRIIIRERSVDNRIRIAPYVIGNTKDKLILNSNNRENERPITVTSSLIEMVKKRTPLTDDGGLIVTSESCHFVESVGHDDICTLFFTRFNDPLKITTGTRYHDQMKSLLSSIDKLIEFISDDIEPLAVFFPIFRENQSKEITKTRIKNYLRQLKPHIVKGLIVEMDQL